MQRLRLLALLPLAVILSSCNAVVLDPSGDVAAQQRDLLLVSTGLMLIIIIPVMALTVFFAWKYRQSNLYAQYDPEWDHSTKLELIIWAAPLLIIICLGAVTWLGTHLLDPYRKIDRISAARPIAEGTEPLKVDVVALDWKWLFFYPQYGIATVNELAAPVDRPIEFSITASSVMNSFFVPALAGQIYAMPAMETKLHAVINEAGVYDGFSANYSGPGFSDMNFKFHGVDEAGFENWVEKAKRDGQALDLQAYGNLAKPSEDVPVMYFASYADGLFDKIVNMCTNPDKMCMNKMMHIDMQGGAGVESHENREKLIYHGAAIDQFSPEDAGLGATAPASGNRPHSDQPKTDQRDDGKGQGTVAPDQLNNKD
ncbi:ubiquinol oxidase subunit II [Aurantimonas sp. VKM B-3413]|uniref:ubiquinol oxidase subunit II n=1 Tax=Aurantimonas sp. VKM B-3413 TaxID=2779401 RepID=UPI001E373111|nr:ubiquinol oxidase subunit II [Aurantimonas sp. VKM B-3413]MCB8837639.1 ubiquinol oxidase subunit II [Aurantimonas sp. VKM B-3413]